MRFSLDALGGLVARRRFGTCSAWRTSAARRSSAAWRFCCWLRRSLATTRTIPSESSRAASFSRIRARSSSRHRLRELGRSQSSSIRVDDVLTCCPPGPPARDGAILQLVARNRDGRASRSDKGRSGIARWGTGTDLQLPIARQNRQLRYSRLQRFAGPGPTLAVCNRPAGFPRRHRLFSLDSCDLPPAVPSPR